MALFDADSVEREIVVNQVMFIFVSTSQIKRLYNLPVCVPFTLWIWFSTAIPWQCSKFIVENLSLYDFVINHLFVHRTPRCENNFWIDIPGAKTWTFDSVTV